VTIASGRWVTLIGNANVDIIVRSIDELPAPGTERRVEAIDVRVGGAAAISALALSALNVPSRLIARLGADHLGALVREGLRDGGVGLEDVTESRSGGTAVSIALEGVSRDRSFLIDLGCLKDFDEAMIPPDALHADAVMIAGYFLAPRLRMDPTRRLLRAAKHNRAITFLDTGWDPDGWTEATIDEVRGLLVDVDVFLPNRDEAGALTGSDEAEVAARALHDMSGGVVVVKQGSDGCVAVASDATVLTVHAGDVQVVDSTGAGDAFNAGLIAALFDGEALPDALGFATRIGTAVVARASADRYPKKSDVT
jgi:sugar/nucleoside kinase (ribokinase family)